jgi:hypothetical protein
MDLEEKIDHNFTSLKNELIDKIKSLADKTNSSNLNLQSTLNNSQPDNENKKKPINEKEDNDPKSNEYKKDYKKHKPPGKNEPDDEHSNIKIKIMRAAKSCESMDDLLQLLNNISIFDSPMIFDFYVPQIH